MPLHRPGNPEFQSWWDSESSRLLLPENAAGDGDVAGAKATGRGGGDGESPAAASGDGESPMAAFTRRRRTRSRSRLSPPLLLLRLRRPLSFVVSIPGAIFGLFSYAARRAASAPASKEGSPRLLRLLRVLLALALILLALDVAAYLRGYHFAPPSIEEATHWMERLYSQWLFVRANYVAPPVQAMANVCVVLFLIQSVDRVVLMLGCIYIKVRGIRPVAAVEYSDKDDCSDAEKGHAVTDKAYEQHFPMVMIQMPMCNEREVYKQSIGAVCILDWPKDRMLVQVLDDSDDMEVQNLIKAEVLKWQQKGVRIIYRHRLIRTGYKAGNLKSAMSCDYVKDYEFVAIFDADFQPPADFLKKTIPYFKGNDDLGLVQARWVFVNKDENLLTRLQNINLSFHFEVEQQVNGVFINFFGFNGTAGVWRIKALEESGGWLERTTVEDMDIAVRAHLSGWKFIFLNDVRCICELPESYEAYKKQQHRWHSGPMQLFRLCFVDILRSKVSVFKKANLIFLFFLLRKLILPFYSFTLFCIILPLTMFLPEAQLPAWVVCYVPGVMSMINVLPSPNSFPFIVPYLLFENTMSVTKFNAMISGLFKLGSSYEWIVTKKLGRSSEADLVSFNETELSSKSVNGGLHKASSESGLSELSKLEVTKKSRKIKKNRLYRKELALAFILLTASARSLLSAQGIHFYFLLFQGVTFLVVGLDLIGEQVS